MPASIASKATRNSPPKLAAPAPAPEPDPKPVERRASLDALCEDDRRRAARAQRGAPGQGRRNREGRAGRARPGRQAPASRRRLKSRRRDARPIDAPGARGAEQSRALKNASHVVRLELAIPHAARLGDVRRRLGRPAEPGPGQRLERPLSRAPPMAGAPTGSAADPKPRRERAIRPWRGPGLRNRPRGGNARRRPSRPPGGDARRGLDGIPGEGGPEIYPPQGSNVGTGKEVGPWTIRSPTPIRAVGSRPIPTRPLRPASRWAPMSPAAAGSIRFRCSAAAIRSPAPRSPPAASCSRRRPTPENCR